MLVIPAIDIRDSKVVRLTKGDFDNQKIYSSNPIEIAKEMSLSAQRIHVVDLDAAKEGYPKNSEIIKEITSSIKSDIEVGGGIRDESVIQSYLNAGIKYCVIGTKAYLDPDWFKIMLSLYGEHIILAMDVLGEDLKICGWKQDCEINAIDVLSDFVETGLSTVIYTDISRDGTLVGIDEGSLSGFFKKIDKIDIKVVISGGVSTMDDLDMIKNLKNDKIFGVIVGKAIYEGKIDISEFKGGIL
ncbi:MAG: 1-(5-phosphoribosyl)-5-[(5-phosphoribosylamino)methylideneamino]imidazole-4-carboxamide isomerase [Candidatus Saelkia tenebricola]|nr:1-(5-phosphoribosyl)-5-[(5-phosphoribosylamino)methylideneamino]imidazole-4-carboxamide isomerase [Candidatus Saelkia tenebricola]